MESKTLNEIAKLMDRILCRTELDDPIHRIALETQNICDAKLMDEPKDAPSMGKLREAVEYCRDEIADLIHDIGGYEDDMERRMKELVAKCNTALADPPRNCDVGTAKEQDSRFATFCNNHFSNPLECGCNNCPCHITSKDIRCVLAWEHMPYKKGGEK